MDEYLFISPSFLIENSVINGNVDFEKLRPTIIHVQDIYLQQILGTKMYEDLQSKGLSSPVGFNSDEILLIKKYIQKTLLWYVLMESSPEFKFKYMNKGVMVKNSENSQAADTRDLLMLMDRWKIKAEQYAELLTKYLKFNSSLFPKYYDVSCEGLNASDTNYTTGIDLDSDIYAKEEECKRTIIISTN
jgi:hypothetical protein